MENFEKKLVNEERTVENVVIDHIRELLKGNDAIIMFGAGRGG